LKDAPGGGAPGFYFDFTFRASPNPSGRAIPPFENERFSRPGRFKPDCTRLPKKIEEESGMPLAKCPLCLRENQKLQDSHYLPQAAYKPSRASGLKNPNPVLIANGRMVQTSDQVRDFVFCWDCEQMLNREGENWVMPQLASKEGFPLLALLHSVPPAIAEGDFDVYYCAGIGGIDCEKLAHFGIGMFWKGHAHKWPKCERLRLGAYGEPIRKFLRGEGPIPEDVALIIQVAEDEPPWSGRIPNLIETQPCHLFNFYLAGIDFHLAVGRGIHPEWRKGCFCHNPERPVMTGAYVGRNEIALLAGMRQKARPSPKLAAFLKGPNPRKEK
jgi:hypothetical protein